MKNDCTNDLTTLYDDIYIDGVCSHFEKCRTDCRYSLNFYKCRKGKDYEKQRIKILIVGKEPVFPENYGGEKITYEITEPCTMKEAGYNNHYLRTFYTAAMLLLDESGHPEGFSKRDMAYEKYEDLRHRFAMTNYYKCVFTDDIKRSGKSTSKKMESNCSDILIKEINALIPDIVIMQGKKHPSFWKRIKYVEISTVISSVSYGKKICSYNQGLYKAETKAHSFLIIDSYHPTSHGIWQNEEVLQSFTALLKEARKNIAP